jgi:hypothetical protein
MSTSTEQSQEAIKTAKLMASVEDMIAALEALAPEADAVAAVRIAELFPTIVKAKQRAASKQQILVLLSGMGLALHPKKFDKLYNAELKARNDLGERYCCIACGQRLHIGQDKSGVISTSSNEGNHATEGAA